MSELIVIKKFSNQHEAELIKGLLDNEGIKSMISSNQLLVHKTDVEKAKEILNSLPQPIEREHAMKCPQCGKEMERGTAEIHGRWYTFLFYGFSHQSLYFRNADYKEEKVLGPGVSKDAFFCKDCRTLSL